MSPKSQGRASSDIVDADGNLAWENADRTLNLAGLEAAVQTSQEIEVDGLVIRVPSLAGYVGLKLFAFGARGSRGSTDLGDLIYVLKGASGQLIEEGRIYDDLPAEVIESLDFDQLGPYLLGRDLARSLPPVELASLLEIIDSRILVPPDYRSLTLAKEFGSPIERVSWFEGLRKGAAASGV